jgi:hypothetical protein
MKYVIVAIVIALFGSTAHAQRGEQRRGGADAPIDKREKVKQKIRALRAYTLTEELSLDDKTAGKLFPVLAKWDDVTDKLIVQRVDLNRQLAAADAKDTKGIDKLIDESVANQKAMWDLEDKRLVELRKILTPAQTAKLIVVLPEFERRIRNQLRRAIQNRGGGNPGDGRFRGRRGGRGADPFDGADDDSDDDEELQAPGARLPERTAPTRGTPRAPERTDNKQCDPFSSVHGCSIR